MEIKKLSKLTPGKKMRAPLFSECDFSVALGPAKYNFWNDDGWAPEAYMVGDGYREFGKEIDSRNTLSLISGGKINPNLNKQSRKKTKKYIQFICWNLHPNSSL